MQAKGFWTGAYVLVLSLVGGCDTAVSTDVPPATGVDGECQAWCEAMERVCPEEALHPVSACLAYCDTSAGKATPEGRTTDQNIDSWGCRQYWLERAEEATDAAQRTSACSAASISGGDVCGTHCDLYCTLAETVCTGGDALFSSRQACVAACSELGGMDDVLPNVSVTPQLFGYGDTVTCRLHHLQAAAVQNNAGLHCKHADPVPEALTCSNTASPNVTNYCVFASEFCGDHLAGVATLDACRASVEAVSAQYREAGFMSFTDTNVNSIGCLNYWVMLAPLDAATYCPMADWDPANWDTKGGSGRCSDR